MAVEGGAFGVQAAGEPCGGDGAGGFVYHRGVVAFDDAVVVGEKEVGLGVVLRGGADGGADCAYIVAQMGDACGGYACENAVGHGDARCVKKRGQILTQAA